MKQIYIVCTGDKIGQIIQLWDDFSLDFSRHKNLLKMSLCDFLEEFHLLWYFETLFYNFSQNIISI